MNHLHVAVLGCGPAGMLTAHAVARTGAAVDIVSAKAQPSTIGGAQYLHRSIPGITSEDPDGEVRVLKLGTREGYARRVYGSSDAKTSWEEYGERRYEVWNLQRAYDLLWQLYGPSVVEEKISPAVAEMIANEYDFVFTTIPAPALCSERHTFFSQEVFIEFESNVPINTIMYNGQTAGEAGEWYRQSNIFGHPSTEWAFAPEGSHGDNFIKVKKPLWNNCDCMSNFDNLIRVGRYGRWEKGQLTHHAYESASATLQESSL